MMTYLDVPPHYRKRSVSEDHSNKSSFYNDPGYPSYHCTNLWHPTVDVSMEGDEKTQWSVIAPVTSRHRLLVRFSATLRAICGCGSYVFVKRSTYQRDHFCQQRITSGYMYVDWINRCLNGTAGISRETHLCT